MKIKIITNFSIFSKSGNSKKNRCHCPPILHFSLFKFSISRQFTASLSVLSSLLKVNYYCLPFCCCCFIPSTSSSMLYFSCWVGANSNFLLKEKKKIGPRHHPNYFNAKIYHSINYIILYYYFYIIWCYIHWPITSPTHTSSLTQMNILVCWEEKVGENNAAI